MVTVANETGGIVLSMQDLREVTGYAAESAQEVLEIFERAHPAALPSHQIYSKTRIDSES